MRSPTKVVREVGDRIRQWRVLARAVGPVGACKYAALRGVAREVRVRPRTILHPIAIRRATSDYEVVRQVFLEKEYAPLDHLADVETVLDLGANVGYASAWFLSHFPRAQVLAVEPDPENFAQLTRNLRAYGARARRVRAGAWSHRCGLRIARAPYRDGRAWARQVEPCGPGEAPEFPGLDVPALLDLAGWRRVSVLKVDIEGAEVVLFGEGADRWLGAVDAFAVELHDDSAFGSGSTAFARAIEGRGFVLSTSGELTIGRRAPAD